MQRGGGRRDGEEGGRRGDREGRWGRGWKKEEWGWGKGDGERDGTQLRRGEEGDWDVPRAAPSHSLQPPCPAQGGGRCTSIPGGSPQVETHTGVSQQEARQPRPVAGRNVWKRAATREPGSGAGQALLQMEALPVMRGMGPDALSHHVMVPPAAKFPRSPRQGRFAKCKRRAVNCPDLCIVHMERSWISGVVGCARHGKSAASLPAEGSCVGDLARPQHPRVIVSWFRRPKL